MPSNDYYVIAYKLLKYLYDSLKNGKPPDMGTVCAEFFGINEEYWQYILRTLYDEGYIAGIYMNSSVERKPYATRLNEIEITPKGIQYLNENSMFQKIKGAVKDIADILPI